MARFPRPRAAGGPAQPYLVATYLVAGLIAIAACSSPTPPGSPTPGASSVPSQTEGQLQSQAPGTSVPATTGTASPGPSPSHTTGGSPTPFQSRLGPDPCRLLTADEVNAALGGGYQLGGGQGAACVFPSTAQGAAASLVSVAVVAGDVISSIRPRYPDLQDVTVDTGKAEWSASVATLWLIIDGPKTVMVSVPGSTLPDDQLQAAALQLAKLAAGRI